MKRLQANLGGKTEGERGIYLAYCIVAMFGSVMSFLVVNQLGGQSEILRSLGAYDIWAISSGAVGAILALRLSTRWLGRRGWIGWLRAAFALPLISFIGSLIAGTLALPIYGTMFGPLALVVTLYENSIVLFLWIWTVFVIHTLFVTYRKERESLFTASERDSPNRLPA